MPTLAQVLAETREIAAPAAPRFLVEQRGPDCFAVLGPNPDHGKRGVCYSGEHLTICTMDGREEAAMVAAALNVFPGAQTWPVS